MIRLALVTVLLAACGGDDDGLPASPDAGVDAGFAPGPHGALPELINLGGGVLTAPRVVPIVFAGDPLAPQIDSFVGMLAGSSYWTQTTLEYGAGPLGALPMVTSADTPPGRDSDLLTWLAAQITTPPDGWPAHDPQNIYAVLLPPGVVFHTDYGDGCDAFLAYHDELEAGPGQKVVYLIVPRCPAFGGESELDVLTSSLSHELVEAATDPWPITDTAFGAIDGDHAIWAYETGGENADMCQYLDNADVRGLGDFVVQRSWSNAAALAGHDPCVPAPEGPFSYAVPAFLDAVHVDDGSDFGFNTRGIKVPVGQSGVLTVEIYSDAPAEPVTVEAWDVASYYYGQPAQLTFAWDQELGRNGQALHLTIQHQRPGDIGGSELLIQTMVGGQAVGQWWGFVSN